MNSEMTKKRLQSILSMIILCLIVVCGLASCAKKHTHEYGEWTITAEAGCETDGTRIRSCTGCDETEQETIKATGHTYGNLIAEVSATCLAEGVKAHYECSACQKTFDESKTETTDLAIAKAGHNYGNLIAEVPATCLATGVKAHYECSVCQKTYDENKNETNDLAIAKADHAYGNLIAEVPATCLAEGVKAHYECSVCQKTFDENKNETNDFAIEKGHALVLVKGKEATCDEDGVKDVLRCVACRKLFDADGEEVTDTVIPALGHTFGDIIPGQAATASENGVKEHKDCVVCKLHFDVDGNELDFLVIPATGHTYSEWIDEVPATCTVDGTKGHYSCEDCSLVFDKDYNEIADLTIKASHELTHVNRKEPTCTTSGYIEHNYCENCGAAFDDDGQAIEDVTLSALDHDYDEWQEGKPATCLEDGVAGHKTCLRCGKNFDAEGTETRVVIPASHTFTTNPEISATCTTDGMQAYKHCSVCGKDYDMFDEEISDINSLVISSGGHNYDDWIAGVPASCSEAGIVGHYHCLICNNNYAENGDLLSEVAIAPLQHVYTTEEIIPEVPAKCTVDGIVAHFECENCGKYFDQSGVVIDEWVIEKTRHTYGSWESGTSATCTEPGRRGHAKCGVCSEPFDTIDYTKTLTEEELIIPAGHHYEHYERTAPTCENEGFEEYYFCYKCNGYFDADKNKTTRDAVIIPATGHDYGTLIEGYEATETERGTISHYQCANCGEYFDSDKYPVCTIYIPELGHSFETWVIEQEPDCTTDGTKGYFRCTHCEKYFDRDYNEITDGLTVPARHHLGELVPAHEGKCYDDDVLISHYQCALCGKYFDENMNELEYNDIFVQASRHNYVYTGKGDESYHQARCLDCNEETQEIHEFDYEFKKEGISDFKKGTCSFCGYETDWLRYERIKTIETVYSYFYGEFRHDTILKIVYVDGNEIMCMPQQVMSEAESTRLYQTLERATNSNETITETFTVMEDDYEGTVTITFRKAETYGLFTKNKYYQKGQLTDLSQVQLLYDKNYAREMREEYNVYSGEIVDNGGFDPDFDFVSNNVTEKTFIIKYKVDGVIYDVEVTLVDDVRVQTIEGGEHWMVKDGSPVSLRVEYTDGSVRYYEVTDDIIVDGSFDPSVVGLHVFTVSIGGVERTLSVGVNEPKRILNIGLVSETVNIGNSLYLIIWYADGTSAHYEVTPDMIEGEYDNTTVGAYPITIYYKGRFYSCNVRVTDPRDERVYAISLPQPGITVWDVDADGNVVPNLENLYIIVSRNDGSISYMQVTEDMITYSALAAKEAFTNGGFFEVIVSYYGKSEKMTVAPRRISELTISGFNFYQKSNLAYGSTSTFYAPNGDLSDYYVRVETNDGCYLISLAKELLYCLENGGGSAIPFDFESAESGKRYEVVLKYAGEVSNPADLLIYAESDVEYSYSMYDSNVSVTVGTREEVLAQLKRVRISLNRHVCGYTDWLKSCYFEELVVAPNQDIDFSKPGQICLKVSYMGVVSEFEIVLAPDVEGVNKTSYAFNENTIDLYENGYFKSDRNWGEYTLVSNEPVIYELSYFGWTYKEFITVSGDSAYQFNASMLEENLEEYTLFTEDGVNVAKVYTKNGLSFADIYSAEGYYRRTVSVKFTLDGKYVYALGIKYLIGKDNLLEIAVEGNVVYRYEQDEDGMITRGTLNDNGKFYVSVAGITEEGVEAEYVVFVYDWREEDGVIKIYDNGGFAIAGTIVDGYFVFDESEYA